VNHPEIQTPSAGHASWSHFRHEADMGVEGTGPSVETAFEQAAVALTAIVTDPGAIRAELTVAVSCDAPDLELLFADWLNAVVYEMATRRMLFSRFEVAIRDHHLEGRLHGEPVEARRHEPAVEVKGATYTELSVREGPAGCWRARCVVDI
jgi:tRNA nucleotidyltransferase (CCA-adding enzyme)